MNINNLPKNISVFPLSEVVFFPKTSLLWDVQLFIIGKLGWEIVTLQTCMKLHCTVLRWWVFLGMRV